MDKGGFSSTEQNNKTIVDAMESQAKLIIEEIVSNKCFDECFDDEVLYLRGERK